jgi:hypothetical protein
MTGLTFDWDDVGISDKVVQKALAELNSDFSQRVWYRVSSSGTGLHVIIAELAYDTSFGLILNPIKMPVETQFEYRAKYSEKPWNLECAGRFFSDQVRSSEGFRTSRVFVSKNGMQAGEWANYGIDKHD